MTPEKFQGLRWSKISVKTVANDDIMFDEGTGFLKGTRVDFADLINFVPEL